MNNLRVSRLASRTRLLPALCCLLAPLASGCNWNAFDTYKESAPIRVHETPGNYGKALYGARLTSVQVDADGELRSSLFASGGAGTPIAIERSWDGTRVSEQGAIVRCQDQKECTKGSDVGATLIAFPTWALGTMAEQNNCVFAPSNSKIAWSEIDARLGGEGFVVCETGNTQSFALGEPLLAARGPTGSLQYSGFALPRAHPLGLLLYGAHGLDIKSGERRGGGVYVQQDYDAKKGSAPLALPVPLIDPATSEPFASDPGVGDLGRQVAGSIGSDGVLVLAVSQPSQQRVLVASYDERLPGAAIDKFRLRACIASPAELRGFGERLVVGDLTGDGKPELVIGADPVFGAEPGKQALFLYRGEALPPEVDGDSCPGWQQAAEAIVCAEQDGVSCAGSAFGASLAIGDVDADGQGDLIVGAPNATVDGSEGAGAVFLLPGARDGLALARTAVLKIQGGKQAHLGAAVTTLRTKDRDEPVASATGPGQLYVFMCSPLEPGFGGASLCLP